MHEKREHKRKPANRTIWCSIMTCNGKIEESGIKAHVVDISEGGMGIMTDHPIKPGCILWFDDEKEHHAGVIRWRTHFKLRNVYRAGIRFL